MTSITLNVVVAHTLTGKLNDSTSELHQAALFSSLSYLFHSEHAARGAKKITDSCHLASSARGGRIPSTK